MKKYGYGILIVLIALSLAASGVALSFLPDIVPVHYNFAGEVDRFGSRFEYLVFPIFGVVGTGVMVLCGRHERKKGGADGALAEGVCLCTGIFMVLLFSGLELFFVSIAASYQLGDTGPAVSPDFMRFIGIGVGLLLVLLGNVMPKARRNAVFGLRTKWSMADDEVWRKSQRFGGFSAVVLGLLLIVTGIFMDSIPHLILCMAVGSVWAGASIWMSYRFYKQTVQNT